MDDFIGWLVFAAGIFVFIRLGKILKEVRDLSSNHDRLFDEIERLRHAVKNAQNQPPVSQPGLGIPQPAPTVAPCIAVSEKPVAPPVQAAGTVPPPLIHKAPRTQAAVLHAMHEEPAKPSPAWVTSGKQALRRIWNWILMGSEERPTGVTLEYAIGTTWLVRAGILFVVLCIGFFLKWSMEHGLLGNTARVAIAMFTGVAMLVGGIQMLNRKYQAIGQGLTGGGILALYFSAYAAGPMYHVVAMPVAFGLMVLLTLTTGVLSVRIDSLLVAVIGLAGGYLTPLLMRTGEPHLAALQAYVILLTAGVLGVAAMKQWRLLNYLSFVLSYILVAASFDFLKAGETPLLLAAVIILFLLHASIACVFNIRRNQESTTLEVIQTTFNALACALFGYHLIQREWGRPYPALLSLGLAIFYAGVTSAFLRRRMVDRTLLTTLIALAGAFTVWTLPLVMERESLTIAFSLLALVFVWLGGRLGSRFLTGFGNVMYAVTLFRVAVWDLPRGYDFHTDLPLTASIYWKALANRLWTFGVPIASFFAACRIKGRTPSEAPPIAPANDVRIPLGPDRFWERSFYWIGVVFLFVFLHLEFSNMFELLLPLRPPALTSLWCVAAGYFLWQFSTSRNTERAIQVAIAMFMTGAVVKLVVYDFEAYRLCDSLFFAVPYTATSALMRMLDIAFVLLLVGTAAKLFSGRPNERTLGIALGYIGLALLFLCSSLELNTLLHWKLPDFEAGGISAWWGIFAIALIAIGIWKNVWALRLIGLILMVVVVGKVLFSDLADMLAIYRVIAFMILGIVMLIGAFAYIKSGRKFQKGDPS